MNLTASAISAFRDRLNPDGDHHLWTGWSEGGTNPVLIHNKTNYRARAVAWWLHHGTDPNGTVTPTCGLNLCLAGGHLADETMRQRERVLWAALHGIALAGPCGADLHDLAVWGEWRSRKVRCRKCEAASRANSPTDTARRLERRAEYRAARAAAKQART